MKYFAGLAFFAALINAGCRSAPASQTIPDGFALIPAGIFTMGSPVSETERRDDEIQRRITISSFYLSKYEVTQEEYQETMGSNPSGFKGDTLPVEYVSWYDAVEYCNRRSQREGLTPVYAINGNDVAWNRKADGYRLPTEAEWEYACRAGTTTPFHTGNSITTSQANYNGNAEGEWRKKTTPVGSFAPNLWGLYDMHGNVSEWCWDAYEVYNTDARTDPANPAAEGSRVKRGGSWFRDGGNLRSAYRGRSDMKIGSSQSDQPERSIDLGFRLARSLFLDSHRRHRA
ncbi:MAG: formylglycine-generating enzyme family protein [Spirochaetaceae bacterium]|jgi:formylglycine-generating enzyme required for sulfatase activity|nr:formylglycine-generating enzyme family protein [Spirochaetaceae bacterium]